MNIPKELEYKPRKRKQFGVLVTKDHREWDKVWQKLCHHFGWVESDKIRELIREEIKKHEDTIQVLFYSHNKEKSQSLA